MEKELMGEEPLKIKLVATMEGRIIRCGCGDPASHPGSVCPNPLRTEELGEVGRSEIRL